MTVYDMQKPTNDVQQNWNETKEIALCTCKHLSWTKLRCGNGKRYILKKKK